MRDKTGISYELLVQSIFQEIHDQEDIRTIKVEHDVDIKGLTTTHQIDVLWRFAKGGITYLTLVQAKDWDSMIKQEQVLAFHAVLYDIPGHPRGVMVTRSGFQSGARTVAEAHDIGLYLLRPRLPHYTTTTLGYVKVTIDLRDRVLRATVFNPEVRTRFILADSSISTRSPIPKTYNPHNVQLLAGGGNVIGSIGGVIKNFIAEMRTTDSLSGRFSRDFPVPTYLKAPSGSKRLHRLVSLTAEIEIVPQPQQPVPWKSSGVVDFILENLQSGEQRTYRRTRGAGT